MANDFPPDFVPPNPPGVDPNVDHGPEVVVITMIMFVLAAVAVALRLISRRLIHLPLGLDDWLILAALLFALAITGGNMLAVLGQHLGQHVAASTATTLRELLAAILVFQVNYALGIALSKLAMVAVYWRIFKDFNIKVPAIILSIMISCWVLASFIVTLNFCHPLRAAWDIGIVLDGKAECINRIAFYIGQGAANIFIDVLLLSLPVTMIWRLQMAMHQKFAVAGIFLMGGIVTICSCIRLWQLITTQSDATVFDPTYSLVSAAIWSVTELDLSIVCACLPCLRPLVRLVRHGDPHGRSGNRSRNDSEPGSSLDGSALRYSVAEEKQSDLMLRASHRRSTAVRKASVMSFLRRPSAMTMPRWESTAPGIAEGDESGPMQGVQQRVSFRVFSEHTSLVADRPPLPRMLSGGREVPKTPVIAVTPAIDEHHDEDGYHGTMDMDGERSPRT